VSGVGSQLQLVGSELHVVIFGLHKRLWRHLLFLLQVTSQVILAVESFPHVVELSVPILILPTFLKGVVRHPIRVLLIKVTLQLVQTQVRTFLHLVETLRARQTQVETFDARTHLLVHHLSYPLRPFRRCVHILSVILLVLLGLLLFRRELISFHIIQPSITD